MRRLITVLSSFALAVAVAAGSLSLVSTTLLCLQKLCRHGGRLVVTYVRRHDGSCIHAGGSCIRAGSRKCGGGSHKCGGGSHKCQVVVMYIVVVSIVVASVVVVDSAH